MQLIDQRLYPLGETYYGEAVHEVDHYEFLITFSIDEAVGNIFSVIEQAASQQGYTLLKADIYYESGTLYNGFDVYYDFITVQIMGTQQMDTGSNRNDYIQQLVAPAIPALYWVAIIIFGAIAAFILIRSFNVSLNSIQYEPTGAGGTKPSWSPLSYAAIFIGAAFLLNALTGVSKEVRKY